MHSPIHHCIVIGNPIAHSKSPDIHHAFARQAGINLHYARQLCPDNMDSFTAVVQAFFAGGGLGANVTLPFKEMAYQLCMDTGILSDGARMAGAVNTLALTDGKLFGDNTDGRGLVADLLSKGAVLDGATVAILGAGGATRGAILPLLQAGAHLTIFNRTLAKAEQLVGDFAPFIRDGQTLSADTLSPSALTGAFDVIINATSAGTTGQALELANTDITARTAYDMMYGKDTEFLSHFRAQGAECFDGFGMLLNQAALAFELWTGVAADSLDLGAVFE